MQSNQIRTNPRAALAAQQAEYRQTMFRTLLGITVLGAFLLQAAFPAQAIWLTLYVGLAGIVWAGSGLWDSRKVLFQETFEEGLSLATRILATAGWVMAGAGGVWILYMAWTIHTA